MRLLLFSVIVMFWSCSDNENRQVTIDGFKQNIPEDSGTQYFPVDSLTSFQHKGPKRYHVENWGSEVLFALREPVLYNYLGEEECIRLTLLRTFENPVIIRLNRLKKNPVYASIKVAKTKSFEKEPFKTLKDTVQVIDEEMWEKAMSRLNTNYFWNEAYSDTSFEGKDGTAWFLECHLKNKYHCIRRWDDGHLSSNDILAYAAELISIGSKYTGIRSAR